jgi:ribosomal protein L2
MRLPLDVDKSVDSKCQVTIDIVSNLHHGKHKLYKVGQNQWLNKHPIVQGVGMNLVDYLHGRGEGCTKGSRPSVSPWGKPNNGGFETIVRKCKNYLMTRFVWKGPF